MLPLEPLYVPQSIPLFLLQKHTWNKKTKTKKKKRQSEKNVMCKEETTKKKKKDCDNISTDFFFPTHQSNVYRYVFVVLQPHYIVYIHLVLFSICTLNITLMWNCAMRRRAIQRKIILCVPVFYSAAPFANLHFTPRSTSTQL